jgi:hypothetical protein
LDIVGSLHKVRTLDGTVRDEAGAISVLKYARKIRCE